MCRPAHWAEDAPDWAGHLEERSWPGERWRKGRRASCTSAREKAEFGRGSLNFS